MPIPKIQGAQRDFSAGELDEALKRSDENPIMKIGARQMLNWRILNNGAPKHRPGRRTLFQEKGRVEEVLMSPGQVFFLAFGPGYLRVYNYAGTRVFNSTVKGDGATAIPWTQQTFGLVSYCVATGLSPTIYICYGDDAPLNVPQVLTWDGVSQSSTWTLTTYAFTITTGNQRRTAFDRLSPPNITIQPSATGGLINLYASAPLFTPAWVNRNITWVNREIGIIQYISPTQVVAGVYEGLPTGQSMVFGGSNPQFVYNVGDVVIGTGSEARGLVTAVSSSSINVQLLQSASGTNTIGFALNEIPVGPGGGLQTSGVSNIPPQAVALWDDEIMNNSQGWPKKCFFDQNRLGFCDFPNIPSGVAWSATNLPNDFYTVQGNPQDAIFNQAPGKSQVLFVIPGMESSEFVFCDNAIYYIPISVTNPLKPGSVAFNVLSEQGSENVQPKVAEQSIIYIKKGGVQIGAVQAPGFYYRPYIVDNVSEFHSHLFTSSTPIAISVQVASSQYEERYIYVLLANGTLVVGKYALRNGLIDPGPDGKPKIGWAPWTGAGSIVWLSALNADLIFTTLYPVIGGGFSSGFSSGFGIGSGATVGFVEVQDDTQYLDGALFYNNLPAAITPPGGKGPLWLFANGSCFVMDVGTRPLGVYQIDANGFLIPQNFGGENLSSAQLVAGFFWPSATLEPFAPDANPGPDSNQRMLKRRIARIRAYVSNSTGFLFARLFAGPVGPKQPALGSTVNIRRVPAYNQDDDPTQPPPQREEAPDWRPLGRAYDPRVAIIKDTPGPLIIHEVGMEVSV